MKIKPEHVAHMKAAINGFLADNPDIVGRYETGNFPRSDKVKNLETRFLFDLLHAANLTGFVCETIYPYANDTHLRTALKSICPKVVKRY